MDLEERGRDLRVAIEQKFSAMKSTKSLRPLMNDMTDFIRNHLPEGTPFDDAEAMLRGAGFRVYPRPSADIPGNRIDRHDVCAELPLAMGTAFLVGMRPKAPGDYSTVNKTFATIRIIMP